MGLELELAGFVPVLDAVAEEVGDDDLEEFGIEFGVDTVVRLDFEVDVAGFDLFADKIKGGIDDVGSEVDGFEGGLESAALDAGEIKIFLDKI